MDARAMSGMSVPLQRLVRDLVAAGGRVARNGNQILVDGPGQADAVRARAEELAKHVIPAVDAGEAELVRELLADAGATVTYITAPAAARQTVAEIVTGVPEVIGLDFETEVLPAF